MRARSFAMIAVAAAGCSGTHSAPSVERTEESLGAAVDLISPATCITRNAKLVSCVVPAQTLTFQPFETAVPLRTTVQSQRTGNCSSQYPLQVALTPAGEATATSFAYLAGGQQHVRRKDGQPIASLALADGSTWTKLATFDQSCRIALAFTPNVPDVDSKADAQALIDKLTADVAAKQATRDRARELDLYAKAYRFLRNVADNFVGQLSNDDIQDLRAAAQDAQPSLELLITSCSNLSQDDRLNLLRLELGLSSLGHPEDWRNPDGSNKTLRDFLGTADQAVIDTVDRLGTGGADGGVPPDYDALYRQAEADYQNALHKLTLAQQQLASYLN